jgi:hypothetical protein
MQRLTWWRTSQRADPRDGAILTIGGLPCDQNSDKREDRFGAAMLAGRVFERRSNKIVLCNTTVTTVNRAASLYQGAGTIWLEHVMAGDEDAGMEIKSQAS